MRVAWRRSLRRVVLWPVFPASAMALGLTALERASECD